jgi:hypothetical protein
MTGFTGSPRLVRGALVAIDPRSGAVVRRVVLQYNPDQVSRTLQLGGGEGEGRVGLLRARTPPVETIKIEAELDAADALAAGTSRGLGVAPAIAALEALVYPRVHDLLEQDRLARAGTLEIAGPEPTLTLFAWSVDRVVPVRISELAVTEEAFDPELRPLRARVSLGMRVLSVHDLGAGTRGGNLYLVYQQRKELLADLALGRRA